MLKILILAISLSSFPTKKDLTEIYNVIKFVETNNNPRAVGDDGRAYGILQIHWVCINDVNKTYNTEFRHRDAFDIETSKEIFNLYIHKGVRLFREKHSRDPTEQEVVRMWNGGIYKGYQYKATFGYYQRYLQFKKRFESRRVEPIILKPAPICYIVADGVKVHNRIGTLFR